MTLKKMISAGAIAGAMSLSAIGLAGAANAAPTPQPGRVRFSMRNWSTGAAVADPVGAAAVLVDAVGVARLPSRFWWTRSDRVGRSAAVPIGLCI